MPFKQLGFYFNHPPLNGQKFMKANIFMAAWVTSLSVNLIHAEPKAVEAESPKINMILKSEVEWTYLNPKRGDLAPSAGTLWGDRNGTGPSGYLLKPRDGFESPPHIHNVSYRGVVIRGLLHNDDPDAADMWMPAGSFWTQPKGEVHVTAAKGTDSLAYIEIEEGPYLVLPSQEAFDSGERPVNMDKANLVWLDASDITWVNQPAKLTTADSPKLAFLWGDTKEGHLNGTFIRLPAGFDGKLWNHGSIFHAVVIKGLPQLYLGESDPVTLEPGSYFSSERPAGHWISSNHLEESILYVRTNGKYDIIPAK